MRLQARFFALALLLILFVPQSSAHQTVAATSSTGDVDTWGISPPPVCPDGIKACLQPQPCPADIYFFTVTLRLLDPSPADVVALTVVADPPAGTQPVPYPTDVATASDPVAEVTVQLGGCNRATTAVVTGILVDGEVSYELTY